MDKSIFDLIGRFKNERRALDNTVKDITIGNKSMLLEQSSRAPFEGASVFGIPVYTDPAVPENCGIMTTHCRHTFFEQEADGGALMHKAKRHTVIMKFDGPVDRTPEEEGE